VNNKMKKARLDATLCFCAMNRREPTAAELDDMIRKQYPPTSPIWDDSPEPTPPDLPLDKRIEQALDVARRYGGIDGDHHKAWVIDQMVRALTGPDYVQFVSDSCDGEDGPDTYSWDEGIPP